jgi:hypothetical protein
VTRSMVDSDAVASGAVIASALDGFGS